MRCEEENFQLTNLLPGDCEIVQVLLHVAIVRTVTWRHRRRVMGTYSCGEGGKDDWSRVKKGGVKEPKVRTTGVVNGVWSRGEAWSNSRVGATSSSLLEFICKPLQHYANFGLSSQERRLRLHIRPSPPDQ
jgi:hypothetical protein